MLRVITWRRTDEALRTHNEKIISNRIFKGRDKYEDVCEYEEIILTSILQR
jgi:hypothetical protein